MKVTVSENVMASVVGNDGVFVRYVDSDERDHKFILNINDAKFLIELLRDCIEILGARRSGRC